MATQRVPTLDGTGKVRDKHLPDRLSATFLVREAPLSPLRYGFVGDGTTDDTAALQDTIDAASAGALIELPHVGNARITAPLSINKPLTIRGRKAAYTQRLLAVGCNGVNVAAGTDDVHLEGFEIAAATRHTASANTLVGVNVDGTSADYTYNHTYADLFLDGFQTGIRARYVWGTTFENIRTLFGQYGLVAYGKSVNNFVDRCQFQVAETTGTAGLSLLGAESATDSTPVVSEGWVIADSLIYGADVGIDIYGVNHVMIHDTFVDFCGAYGIRALHSPAVFTTNLDIHDNYIAMGRANGAAGVILGNATDNIQRRTTTVHDNEILVYTDPSIGGVCAYGIITDGPYAQANIDGNKIKGFAAADIRLNCADNIVRGNRCMSTPSLANIYSQYANLVADNIGSVFRTGVATTAAYDRDPLGRKRVVASDKPASGTWALGDRVMNDVPAVGSPKGWICTAAGTPGTWVSEGNL